MAAIDVRLTREIREAGLAGGILFAWIDEWFKHNWVVIDLEAPLERTRLWHNAMDAEQNYGLLGQYAGTDRSRRRWAGDPGALARAAVARRQRLAAAARRVGRELPLPRAADRRRARTRSTRPALSSASTPTGATGANSGCRACPASAPASSSISTSPTPPPAGLFVAPELQPLYRAPSGDGTRPDLDPFYNYPVHGRTSSATMPSSTRCSSPPTGSA